MNSIRPPTASDVARLFLVSAIWGVSFLCIDIALTHFAPLAIAAWRVLLAAAVVLVLCRVLNTPIPWTRRNAVLFMSIGMLNSAVPFTLIGWGQRSVDPGTSALLIATSPFATLLLSHWVTRDDRFSTAKLLGLLLGFCGVMVLLWQEWALGAGSLPGMLVIMLAAVCYSVSALLIRPLGQVASLAVVGGTLSCSALVLLPLLLWLHPPWQQSADTPTILALVVLGLGPTAWAYVLRTRIVQLNGAVFMSNAGYLIPLFAVFWAWLSLGTGLRWQAVGAMVLIFSGLAVGQAQKRRPRIWQNNETST